MTEHQFKKQSTAPALIHQIKRGLFWIALFSLAACSHRGLRISLPESRLPFDQAWSSSLDTSLLYYERIAIDDKEAGYFQTTWDIHKVGIMIGSPVKRSRLIGRVTNKAPFRLDLDIEQEAFSMELGRWVSDAPDKKRLGDIVEKMRARLLF